MLSPSAPAGSEVALGFFAGSRGDDRSALVCPVGALNEPADLVETGLETSAVREVGPLPLDFRTLSGGMLSP